MAREDEIPKRARRSLDDVKRKAKKGMEAKMRLCGKKHSHKAHHYRHWGVMRFCDGSHYQPKGTQGR